MQEHELTHIPFRSWCPHCVKGRAKSAGHSEAGKEESTIPVISLDYAYMKERDGHQEEEEQGNPIIVMKDRKTKMRFASMVTRKGDKDEIRSCKGVKRTSRAWGTEDLYSKAIRNRR